MARVWGSWNDVDRAVNTIKKCMEETGVIPDVLVKAYQTSMERCSHGLIQRFFEQLTEKCPRALRYFVPTKQPNSDNQPAST